MFTIIKNIFIILLITALVYFTVNNLSFVKNQIASMLHIPQQDLGVLSTEKGQHLARQFNTDIGSQVNTLGKNALNLKIGDALTYFSRMQKIPKDIHSAESYVTNQAGTYLKKYKM